MGESEVKEKIVKIPLGSDRPIRPGPSLERPAPRSRRRRVTRKDIIKQKAIQKFVETGNLKSEDLRGLNRIEKRQVIAQAQKERKIRQQLQEKRQRERKQTQEELVKSTEGKSIKTARTILEKERIKRGERRLPEKLQVTFIKRGDEDVDRDIDRRDSSTFSVTDVIQGRDTRGLPETKKSSEKEKTKLETTFDFLTTPINISKVPILGRAEKSPVLNPFPLMLGFLEEESEKKRKEGRIFASDVTIEIKKGAERLKEVTSTPSDFIAVGLIGAGLKGTQKIGETLTKGVSGGLLGIYSAEKTFNIATGQESIGQVGGEVVAFTGLATGFDVITERTPKIETISEESITRRIIAKDQITDITKSTTKFEIGKKQFEVKGKLEQKIVEVGEGFRIEGRGKVGKSQVEFRGIGKDLGKFTEAETLSKITPEKGKPTFRVDITSTRELRQSPTQVLESLTRGGTIERIKPVSIENLKTDIATGSKSVEIVSKQVLSESGKVIATEQLLGTRRAGTSFEKAQKFIEIKEIPSAKKIIQQNIPRSPLKQKLTGKVGTSSEILSQIGKQEAVQIAETLPKDMSFQPIKTVSISSKSVQKDITKSLTKTTQKQEQRQATTTKRILDVGVINVQEVKPISFSVSEFAVLSLSKSLTKPISKTGQVAGSKVGTITMPRLDVRQRQMTESKSVLVPIVPPPPVPAFVFEPPPLFGTPGIERKEKRKQMVDRYDVYGKSRGRNLKLNQRPLSKQNAMSLGARLIDNSTARTFSLEKTQPSPRRRGEWRDPYWTINQFKFRPQIRGGARTRENIYVEKSRFAIDSLPEIQGIPLEGLLAQRRKGRKKSRRKKK